MEPRLYATYADNTAEKDETPPKSLKTALFHVIDYLNAIMAHVIVISRNGSILRRIILTVPSNPLVLQP